jgi:hypothetical protein
MSKSADQAKMPDANKPGPWQLSPADSKVIAEALLNPAEPNLKLQAAADRYRQKMGLT